MTEGQKDAWAGVLLTALLVGLLGGAAGAPTDGELNAFNKRWRCSWCAHGLKPVA